MADGGTVVSSVQRDPLMARSFKELCGPLGHDFKQPELLKQAVTLGFGNYFVGYERLEFLGDRVLGLIVAQMLFTNFPNEAEGDLARRHSDLVRAETLAVVAEKLDLGAYFIFPKHEEPSVDRHSKTLLSDVCEAVIAALFLDGGLDTAAAFVRRYWEPLMKEFKAPPVDAKTRLQEWAQGRGLPLPVYSVVHMSGPDHEPTFVIRVQIEGYEPVTAEGPSKRAAGQEAAGIFLKSVEGK